MKTFEEILVSIQETNPNGVAARADENMSPKGIIVDRMDLLRICQRLHEEPSLYFDMLSCITAIDNGVEAGTIDVVYNLYSIPFDQHLALKVVLPRDKPSVDSVCGVWRTADWHEREAWDMFGITFNGHPDLRRILLPADWEGHPLRKDYKQQEYYRGVKVD